MKMMKNFSFGREKSSLTIIQCSSITWVFFHFSRLLDIKYEGLGEDNFLKLLITISANSQSQIIAVICQQNARKKYFKVNGFVARGKEVGLYVTKVCCC